MGAAARAVASTAPAVTGTRTLIAGAGPVSQEACVVARLCPQLLGSLASAALEVTPPGDPPGHCPSQGVCRRKPGSTASSPPPGSEAQQESESDGQTSAGPGRTLRTTLQRQREGHAAPEGAGPRPARLQEPSLGLARALGERKFSALKQTGREGAMGLGSGDGAAGGPRALRSKLHHLVGAADPPSPHGAINTPDRSAEPSCDGIRKGPAAGAEAWVTGVEPDAARDARDAREAPPSHRCELCSGGGGGGSVDATESEANRYPFRLGKPCRRLEGKKQCTSSPARSPARTNGRGEESPPPFPALLIGGTWEPSLPEGSSSARSLDGQCLGARWAGGPRARPGSALRAQRPPSAYPPLGKLVSFREMHKVHTGASETVKCRAGVKTILVSTRERFMESVTPVLPQKEPANTQVG